MEEPMLAFLQFYQTYYTPVSQPGIPLVALLLLWFALRRTGLSNGARTATWFAIAIFVVSWFAAAQVVTRSGFYQNNSVWMRLLCWLIGLATLAISLRSSRMREILSATPGWWLVAFQVYRFTPGAVFLTIWALGRAPTAIALPAGIGDGLVGLLALPVAAWVWSGRTGAAKAGIAWNALGLADFFIAFCIGTFVPFGLTYPAVMVPAFLAPLSVVFHGLSIAQLSRSLPAKAVSMRLAVS
jgi:hypothetical protein